MSIRCTKKSGTTRNILGRKYSSRAERITLTAHYDTVFGTPSAYDNASGVSVLLTLAEAITKHVDITTGIEFVAFSSEEYQGLGDRVYIENNKSDFENVLAAINFDGVGQLLGTNNFTLMAGSEDFKQNLLQLKKSYPAVQWTNPWYESNHFTFFSRGVPSIPFSSHGVTNLFHTKEDKSQWISPDKLYEVYSLALQVISSLQDRSVIWTR